MSMEKFFPLLKVDEQSHMIYGLVTAETPDRDKEICDYGAAKADYQRWRDEFLAKTAAAGQDSSMGNVRLMHAITIAGKATRLDFNDDAKQIYIGVEPANDEIWKLAKGGFVTGFSQGGDYAWRRPEGEYVRYAPRIAEVSLVDSPCLPEATFAYVKADGSSEMRKFNPPTKCACGKSFQAAAGQTECPECAAKKTAAKAEVGSMVTSPSGTSGSTVPSQSIFDSSNPNPTAANANGKAAPGIKEGVTMKACSKCGKNFTGESDTCPECTAKKVVDAAIAAHDAAHMVKDAKTKLVTGEDLGSDCFAFVGDPQDTSTWKYPIKFSTEEKSKSHVRNALARWGQHKGIPASEEPEVLARIKAAAKKFGISVSDEADKVLKVFEFLSQPLKKGMYTVQQMAQILDTLSWLQLSSTDEQIMERDEDSTQPADLADLLSHAIDAFRSMVAEETSELEEQAARVAGKGEKAMNAEELLKLMNAGDNTGAATELSKMDAGSLQKLGAEMLAKARSVHTHLDGLHKMCKDFHDKMTGLHKAHMDASHEAIGKCRKALGAEVTGNVAGSMTEGSISAGGSQGSYEGAPHAHDTGAGGAKATDAGELLKALQTLTEKVNTMEATIADSVLKSLVGALEAPDPNAPAPGIGDRSQIVHKANEPHQTHLVTKIADTGAPFLGPGAPANGGAVQPAGPSAEDVKKAAGGDIDATLALVRSIKKADSIPASLMGKGLRARG